MKSNPFKYGSIVDVPYFFNRKKEIEKVKSILNSQNHLIIISPRRYGKTSLINQVLKQVKRPSIFIDMQMITSVNDLAERLLKKLYALYPHQKLKHLVKNFRIIPSINLNPATNEVEISFTQKKADILPLEDVLNLFDKLGDKKKGKLIVVFNEFQDILRIEKRLDFNLRSILQHHKNVNYVFSGSQESMMREIFEKKRSPFYHFGFLYPLDKIQKREFVKFIDESLKHMAVNHNQLAEQIVELAELHPYYTQQLAFNTWEVLNRDKDNKAPVDTAIAEIIQYHDYDYEQIWNTLKRTDMKIMIGMAVSDISPLSSEFTTEYNPGPTSTVFSSIKRLMKNGFVVKSNNKYVIDNPFFKRWIVYRRKA